MSEFQYDIKLYSVNLNNKTSFKDFDIMNIGYEIDIFCMNDPEIIFRYRYPKFKLNTNFLNCFFFIQSVKS